MWIRLPAIAKPKPTNCQGVINGEALTLPKPFYPPAAKLMRIQGKVSIQILIDETGKVLSARAIDGPLKQSAEQYQARFSQRDLATNR
jgi:hypothetical protein